MAAGKAQGDCQPRKARTANLLSQTLQFAHPHGAMVEIDLNNMATTSLRVLRRCRAGGVPGAESSMLKIRGTVIRSELLSLIAAPGLPYALPYIEEAQFAESPEALVVCLRLPRLRPPISTTAAVAASAAPARNPAQASSPR